MNDMKKYDDALMEGSNNPKIIAKKRIRAFIEAASEIAPKGLVESIVDAHDALFEYHEGRTRTGIRFRTGLGATDPRKTNPWSYKTRINGNDAVANDYYAKPPTGANVIAWTKQRPEGSAAYRHYEDVEYNRARRKIDPRDYPTMVNFHPDDSWDDAYYASARRQPVPPPPPPPQQTEQKQKIQQPEQTPPQPPKEEPPKVEPPKAEPPKEKQKTQQECPPACPTDDSQIANVADNHKGNNTPKKPATRYVWKEDDFLPIENTKSPGTSCSTTHRYVINLVSFDKENDGAANKVARFLTTHGIRGVYTYQYDGIAQNTTRKDVWRVRIGYFASKAAAKAYFRTNVRKHVGDQFNWWVGTCDGNKGDNIKPGTFKLGANISDNDCVDETSVKPKTEQTVSNTHARQSETPSTKKRHGNIMDFVKGK